MPCIVYVVSAPFGHFGHEARIEILYEYITSFNLPPCAPDACAYLQVLSSLSRTYPEIKIIAKKAFLTVEHVSLLHANLHTPSAVQTLLTSHDAPAHSSWPWLQYCQQLREQVFRKLSSNILYAGDLSSFADAVAIQTWKIAPMSSRTTGLMCLRRVQIGLFGTRSVFYALMVP